MAEARQPAAARIGRDQPLSRRAFASGRKRLAWGAHRGARRVATWDPQGLRDGSKQESSIRTDGPSVPRLCFDRADEYQSTVISPATARNLRTRSTTAPRTLVFRLFTRAASTPATGLSSALPNSLPSGSPAGAPKTPIFTAKAGDPVRFRVLQPGGDSIGREHHVRDSWPFLATGALDQVIARAWRQSEIERAGSGYPRAPQGPEHSDRFTRAARTRCPAIISTITSSPVTARGGSSASQPDVGMAAPFHQRRAWAALFLRAGAGSWPSWRPGFRWQRSDARAAMMGAATRQRRRA